MIGGNITAQLQLKSGTVKNDIGEVVPQFTTVQTLTGWIDFSLVIPNEQALTQRFKNQHTFSFVIMLRLIPESRQKTAE